MDGAIHQAAGKYLLAENKSLGCCPDGEAKISGGYNLPTKCKAYCTACCMASDMIPSRYNIHSWPKRRTSHYSC